MSTVVDYVGRTVDVVAFHGVKLAGEAHLVQALLPPGSGGEVCTGVQKLAQRVLIEFLTIAGSLTYLPDRGCAFVGQLRRGELHTSIDAQQAFYLSAQQVKDNLRAEEDAVTPDDESFGSLTLDHLTITGDTIIVQMHVTSVAGGKAPIILPISITV